MVGAATPPLTLLWTEVPAEARHPERDDGESAPGIQERSPPYNGKERSWTHSGLLIECTGITLRCFVNEFSGVFPYPETRKSAKCENKGRPRPPLPLSGDRGLQHYVSCQEMFVDIVPGGIVELVEDGLTPTVVVAAIVDAERSR